MYMHIYNCMYIKCHSTCKSQCYVLVQETYLSDSSSILQFGQSSLLHC